jgi:glycosyltransferase involved in cell wall biosynthesis
MLIHQLAREVWWYESPFPLNALGFVSEPWYLRIYRRTPVVTVSRSTKEDLRSLGFLGPITVIPEGLNPIRVPLVRKEARPTFLYVGRLSPSKRVADVVKAFALFRRASPGKLWIAGNSPDKYLGQLIRLVDRLGLNDDVQFFGRVANDEKHSLMARAHALVLASAREGWGLVVTEANACGTPAIVYDVPGLRDSVRNGETGLVVRRNPEALAEAMIRLSCDGIEYARLATSARAWSNTFSYDLTTDAFAGAMAQLPNNSSQKVRSSSR